MKRTFLLIALPLTMFVPLFAQGGGPLEAIVNDWTRAEERTQARDWKAALPLWLRVVSANPHEGYFWYRLGSAQYNTEQYREAIRSYEKAMELGTSVRRSNIALEIARSHARLKEKEAALKALQRAFDLGYRYRDRLEPDEDFAFLRGDPRFQSLAGEAGAKRTSRTERWRYDVSFLAAEIKRMHYRPFRKIPERQFDAEVQRLLADIPRLNDNEIAVRIMRFMALIGDGHTGMFPDIVPKWNAAPLILDLFEEGVFVTAADPKYADIVGWEVVRIAGETPKQVIAKLDPIISKDSPQAVARSAGRFMSFPQILNGLGIQSQADHLELTVRNAGGTTRTLAIPTVPVSSRFNRFEGEPSWASVLAQTPAPPPLYLKDRRTNYWFEELPGKVLYFQFNLVVNGQNESFSAYVDRLFKYIDEHRIERLIIDMRWNNGGNALLLSPLINGLVSRDRLNRRGHLFALIGRYTFSAATVAASRIESDTNSLLVGEPMPTGPNFIGESNLVTLPYSRLRVSISDLYHQTTWSADSRRWIAPLLYVPVTFKAYKAKRDPAMEAILAYE